MKIKTITSQHCNDFSAILECEHCEGEQKLTTGYHDNFYHTMVIPAMHCQSCGLDRAGQERTEEVVKTKREAGINTV